MAVDEILKVGLVVAPDLPAEMAERLGDRLPGALKSTSGGAEPDVSVVRRALPGGNGLAEMRDAERKLAREQDLDLGFCVTDLPFQHDWRPVIADLDLSGKVGLISIPAPGPAHTITDLVDQVVDQVAQLIENEPDATRHSQAWRGAERLKDVDGSEQVLYVAPPVGGNVRLVLGMVRANRPWRLFLGLSGGAAAALAAAALAIITSGVWILGDALDVPRLALLMVGSVAPWLAG